MSKVVVDWARCRRAPREAQKAGIRLLIAKTWFGLFDEMGVGKTKQAVDAALFLFLCGLVDTIVVVTPSAVRPVWAHPDPEIGGIAADRWEGVDCRVTEFHSGKSVELPEPRAGTLDWIVTNYEFIRSGGWDKALGEQLDRQGRTFALVCDEAHWLKDHKAAQTKAVIRLRKRRGARRAWLLTGTPVAQTPLDTFGLSLVMSPAGSIFGTSFFLFRARYAVMGGFAGKQILGFQNLEDLQARMAPHCVRRLTTDCLDLPEQVDMPPVLSPLSGPSWAAYRRMRDDAVTWLDGQEGEVSLAPHGVTRMLRLAQITSGFLGGVEDDPQGAMAFDGAIAGRRVPGYPGLREIGREKTDAAIDWIQSQDDADMKLIVWSRFKPEMDRLTHELSPLGATYEIRGEQRPADRQSALEAIGKKAIGSPGRAFVVGNPAAGGLGVDATAAHRMLTVSRDFSLVTHVQARKRIHRPPQARPCVYTDVVAVGPGGQKTIDHAVARALKAREDVATWTAAAWRRALVDEAAF